MDVKPVGLAQTLIIDNPRVTPEHKEVTFDPNHYYGPNHGRWLDVVTSTQLAVMAAHRDRRAAHTLIEYHDDKFAPTFRADDIKVDHLVFEHFKAWFVNTFRWCFKSEPAKDLTFSQ